MSDEGRLPLLLNVPC